VIARDRLPNTYLRQFFRYLGNRAALLSGTSETPESLAQLHGSNSFRDYCQFFRNAQRELDDPAIGLRLGRVNQLANMHGPVTTAIFLSHDIRDCLQLLVRFTPLRLPIISIEYLEERDDVGLQIELPRDQGEIPAAVIETLLLSLAGAIAAISQGDVHPSHVELDFPRPLYAQRYPEAFETYSFEFSRPALRLMVARTDALLPGPDADAGLRDATIQRCEELLRGVRGEQRTSDQIREILAANPGHLWGLADMAKYLNCSQRTLQRRLAAEITSYRRLHDEWLRNEAQKLLRERNLSVESIAALLGYNDVSNFRHAFRRWFGRSPQAYRNRLNLDAVV